MILQECYQPQTLQYDSWGILCHTFAACLVPLKMANSMITVSRSSFLFGFGVCKPPIKRVFLDAPIFYLEGGCSEVPGDFFPDFCHKTPEIHGDIAYKVQKPQKS